MTNPTIRDVARQAGVSITTVSHVLSGGPNGARYSPDTMQRVREAAQQLGYAPSRRGYNMRKGRNGVVSLFLTLPGAFDSGYQCMIFTGAALASRESGYSVEIVNPDKEANLARVLGNTDGVAFCVQMCAATEAIVRQSKLPAVRLNLGSYDPADGVEPDDRAGAAAIGLHLRTLGYQRIVYVSPLPGGHPSIRVREAALAEAAAGLAFDTVTLDGPGLQPVIHDLQRHALPRTAFVAYADSIRVALQQKLFRAGLLIPDDVGLASCHTGLFGRTIDADLPVTGATYRALDLGVAGARMLLERIGNGGVSVPSVLVPETFIEGKTTCRQDA
jgi:LacI family transcriptional regulator